MLPVILKEKQKLCGSKNKMPKKISGTEMDEGNLWYKQGMLRSQYCQSSEILSEFCCWGTG
jgi:hypothetical protein